CGRHRAALRVHCGRLCGRRTRRGRADPDPRDPLSARRHLRGADRRTEAPAGPGDARDRYGRSSRAVRRPTGKIGRPTAARGARTEQGFPRRAGARRGRSRGAARRDPWAGRSARLRVTGPAAKAMSLPGELKLHQRKFLELARALASRPILLLLDEVFSGLTHAEIDDAIRLIREIRARGATIVFVEHVIRAVLELT